MNRKLIGAESALSLSLPPFLSFFKVTSERQVGHGRTIRQATPKATGKRQTANILAVHTAKSYPYNGMGLHLMQA